MKRWLIAIIIGNLGRFFNNPQLFNNLEYRLAESGPIKQLARTIVGFYQRGSWEIKQLKEGLNKLESESFKKGGEDLARKLKDLETEWKKRSSDKSS